MKMSMKKLKRNNLMKTQFLADIPLNDIGSVKIDKGNGNSDGFKKELSVSANNKKCYFKFSINMKFLHITETPS